MIVLKTSRELSIMRKAGKISQKALRLAGEAVEPGFPPGNRQDCPPVYRERGGNPQLLGYSGYPASACISVNNVVIHGIPSKSTILKHGDIVSVDVGAFYQGFHGDNAWTFPCGQISEEARALLEATEKSLFLGIEQARPGNRIGDVGHAVQGYVEARGYSVVREFVGHGVGAKLHEDPSVPNYGTPGRGVRLMPGMVIAIEPMINVGKPGVKILDDGWTTVTQDGSLSAHFEHTVPSLPMGPCSSPLWTEERPWSGNGARLSRSACRHDQGSFLTVLEAAPPYAVVADGKRRPLERPKRKKLFHLAPTSQVLPEEALKTNRQIRAALRSFEQAAVK